MSTDRIGTPMCWVLYGFRNWAGRSKALLHSSLAAARLVAERRLFSEGTRARGFRRSHIDDKRRFGESSEEAVPTPDYRLNNATVRKHQNHGIDVRRELVEGLNDRWSKVNCQCRCGSIVHVVQNRGVCRRITADHWVPHLAGADKESSHCLISS